MHYQSANGLIKKDHDAIMEQIESMIMDVEPTDLLPEHRKLLQVD